MELPCFANCSNFYKTQHTRSKSRADLPDLAALEKDFTELMMSDTSASVSDPSQCVKQVAPLPEEDVRRQLNARGRPLGIVTEMPNSSHCKSGVTATSTTSSAPLRKAEAD